MKFSRKNLYKHPFLFIVLSLSFIPASSFAAKICDPGKLCNPIDSDTIQEFILTFLEGAIKIGIPIVALAIIYSGFLFVSSSGNSEKLGKAKNALLYSVIGAAILLGALAISKLVAETVTGISS
ncbi:hypothetical protein HZA26_03820 [Candidatus Nomurabacteria bacterium]|nr:hypothetical protein [Candidatus Nomurabacteria bacterium]